MNSTTFKDLRRALPMNKQKLNWEQARSTTLGKRVNQACVRESIGCKLQSRILPDAGCGRLNARWRGQAGL